MSLAVSGRMRMSEVFRLVTLAVLIAACSEPSRTAGHRPVVWDTVFRLGGSVEDSLLLIPRLMTAGSSGLYVYDYGSHSLKAFDLNGRFRWAYGRSGSGPGEFRNPIDLRTTEEGTIWVLDGGLGRIAVVDSSAVERESIALRHPALPQRLAILDSVVLVLLLEPGDNFFGILDGGHVRDVRPFPTDTIGSVDPYLRIVTAATHGEYWTAAYVFGNRFYAYRNTNLMCAGTLRHGSPFLPNQRAKGDEREVAAGTVMSDSSIWMLAIDPRDRDLRYLDEYSLTTCEYRGSLPLPVRARTIAYHDGVFFVEHARVAPEILALRPR
jgi:hypothetical protein